MMSHSVVKLAILESVANIHYKLPGEKKKIIFQVPVPLILVLSYCSNKKQDQSQKHIVSKGMSNRRMFLPVAFSSTSTSTTVPFLHIGSATAPFNPIQFFKQNMSSLPLSGSHHIPIDVIVSPILSQGQRPKPPKLH